MSSTPAAADFRAFFLDGSAGKLFCVYFEPQGECRGAVLLCPPFAEEMNKSRRMMSLTAAALAARGYGVLLLDLFGTGDSEGDFGDADWPTWQDDVQHGARWLLEHLAAPLAVIGIRLGALLALEVARSCADSVQKLVLWQPVVAGKTFMTQFLRLKMASELAGSAAGTSTRELREKSADGETLEIAGYQLSSSLLAAVDDCDLRKQVPPEGVEVAWLEVVGDEARPPTPVSRSVVSEWQSAGVAVELATVTGEPFWSTPEIALAPDLISRSVDHVDPRR